jgi:hypothetical protein
MSQNPMPTWLFALIAAIFWVVSVGLFAIARHEHDKSRDFMSVARPATGKCVGHVVWEAREPGMRGRVRGSTYPEIEFETETGQKVRFVAASSGDYAFKSWSTEVGREYSLLYDPKNPSRAQLVGVDTGFKILYLGVFILVIPAVVFTILWLRRLSA